ncbi:hypothetical protein H4R19_006809, partial [Coemansia spiralis]
ICGAESLAEIEDDPAMAQLYEGIGVFFSHWGSRRPGVATDSLMWSRLDRRSWGLVKAPILCLTGTTDPAGRASEAEEEARAALVSTRSIPEFARIGSTGRMLFPLARTSRACLDFIYRNQ